MLSIPIFVINLKKSADRREYIATQLQTQNINFTFFEAIDGSDKKNPLLKRYNYIKRLWLTSGKMPTNGEIGCYASHYSLWQKCVDLGEPIVVVEDDAGICEKASLALKIAENKIAEYGFLRLEEVENSATITIEQQLDYTIKHISKNFWGTRAYAIAPWAANKLLANSKRWSVPVDNYIGANFLHGVESYHLTPNLAKNRCLFDTTIQTSKNEKTPLYRKPSREFYTAYCQLKQFFHNRKFKKALKVKQ